MDCQKTATHNIRHENTQSKIKPLKTGKEIGTTYCLGCKYCADNFKPQEKKRQIKYFEKNQTVLFIDLVN